jgi:lipoate-protein ligase A
MNSWQFIVEGKCQSHSNMECDLKLFETVCAGHEQGIVRIYDWDEPALTIGHHQRYFSFFDKDLKIPVISRPTGGGAVLHGDDITFCLCTTEKGCFSKGIHQSYILISQMFASALKKCGLDVEIQGKNTKFSEVCFARSSPAELVFSGKKILGLALLRSRGCLLMQGVLPLRVNKALSQMVFGPRQAEYFYGILDFLPGFKINTFIEQLTEVFACETNILLSLQRKNNDKHSYNSYDGKIYPWRHERGDYKVTQE